LHGTIPEAARQRQREVALRVALGAGPSQLTFELSRACVQLAAIGSAIGGLVGIILAPSVKGTVDLDVRVYWLWLSALAIPILVGMFASVFPIYRVLRTDLTKLLRR
jgi:ABC-type antimicrobial peptide transport system permease subunit